MLSSFSNIGYYATKTAASLRSRAAAGSYKRRHPEMPSAFRSPDYEALHSALGAIAGLQLLDYPVDAQRYRDWVREARYPALAYVVNRTEKFIEHQISFDLLAPAPGSLVMDVASCRSTFPAILRRRGHRSIAQDLEFAPGLHDDKLGGSASAMDLPDETIDGMTLHCSFEHFEGTADAGFVREAGRVLRPGGKVVILPLYLHHEFINMTDPIFASGVPIDDGATAVAVFGYANRFGRHYSIAKLRSRVIEPALAAGLSPVIYRIRGSSVVSPRVYVNFALVLTKTPR